LSITTNTTYTIFKFEVHCTWPKPAFTNALTKVAARFCLAESTFAPVLAWPSSKCVWEKPSRLKHKVQRKQKIAHLNIKTAYS
jgi:hypothetical protein